MIEQLRQYQIEYLNIIKEFSKQDRKYEEYLGGNNEIYIYKTW